MKVLCPKIYMNMDQKDGKLLAVEVVRTQRYSHKNKIVMKRKYIEVED